MKRRTIIFACLSLMMQTACNSFLDIKPDSALAVLETVDDYLAILQNETRMNQLYPFAYDYASDHFYLSEEQINAMDETGRYAYLWLGEPCHQNNWNQNYARIYDANVVLEGIDKAKLGNRTEQERQSVKGAAAFTKAFTLMHLAALYTPPFERGNNRGKLGVPIRPSANIEEKSVRPTLDDCYQEIERLLLMAGQFLPLQTKAKTFPNKEAAWAAMARLSLITQDYERAYRYADSCLQYNADLIDYNTLNPNVTLTQFAQLNKEVILHTNKSDFTGLLTGPGVAVDSILYTTYAVNDLRKSLFYKKDIAGVLGFYGGYDGKVGGSVFSGIARDEIYLIAAEAAVRLGKLEPALKWINLLLEKRMAKQGFIPIASSDMDYILDFILEEREKELAFRSGLRWMDLRRLNLEDRHKKTLTRKYQGKVYRLEPNDIRYTFKIPDDIIAVSKIEQNP